MVCCILAVVLSNIQTAVAQPSDDVVAKAHKAVVAGKPLSYWVAQASKDLSPEETRKAVDLIIDRTFWDHVPNRPPGP